jgi:hypothetical protein
VAASTTLHEEVDGAYVDLPFADGDTPWAPRDAQLTYHGIQPVHDEFARTVDALVFRFPEMVFVTDEVTLGPDGLDIDGHYEAHDYEYHFDATDGRLIGVVDVTAGVRGFQHPDTRHPFGSLSVIGMAFRVFGLSGGQDIHVSNYLHHRFLAWFEPYGGDRPLSGDCSMWQLRTKYDPPLPEDPTDPLDDAVADLDPSEVDRTLLCMQDHAEVPLWSYSGNQSSSYRLERRGPDLPAAPFEGIPLTLVPYPLEPWQEVDGLLPVPGPLLVPPTSDGGLWAQRVADKAAAFYLSPGYLQYRAASGLPYVEAAILDIDYAGLLLPDGLPDVPLPLEARARTSVFFLTDAAMRYIGFVHSAEREPEGPNLHMADPQGSTFPESSKQMPADQLPSVVSDGLLEGQLAPLLPERLDSLVFFAFGLDRDEDGAFENRYALWQPQQDCTRSIDGWVAIVDGIEGYVGGAARIPSGEGDCKPDPAWLEIVRKAEQPELGLRLPGTDDWPGRIRLG